MHAVAKEKLAAAAAMTGNGATWLAPATPAAAHVHNGYPADETQDRWNGTGPFHPSDEAARSACLAACRHASTP